MRLKVVDIMKGFAIVMIVNVHLIGGAIFPIGSTFHVITFFFTSGILHGVSESWNTQTFGKFFQHRFSRLMYPFFTLSICYICFRIILNVVREGYVLNDVIKDSIIKTITLQGIGTLWFLPVLFLSEIIFFYLKGKRLHDGIIIVFGILIIFISSYLNRNGICGSLWYGDNSLYGFFINNPITILLSSLIAILFIDLGYVLYKIDPKLFLNDLKNEYTIVKLCIACFVFLLIDYLLVDFYRGDLHKLDIGNPFVYFLCSISGITFVFTLSMILNQYVKNRPSLIKHWGKNSLIIMTTHSEYFINSISFIAITSLLPLFNITVNSKVITGLSLFVIMIIETGIIYIINHSLLKYLYKAPTISMIRN